MSKQVLETRITIAKVMRERRYNSNWWKAERAKTRKKIREVFSKKGERRWESYWR